MFMLVFGCAAICFADDTPAEVKESDSMMPADKIPSVYYGTAIIDGEKDGVYTEEPQLVANKRLSSSLAEDGTSAKVWLTWDYDGLYVYAEMDEKTPSWSGLDEYLKDSLEVFVDADLSRNTVADTNDAQYRVTIAGSTSYGMSAPKDFRGAANYEENSGKYSVELLCPWADILPADGSLIGFDIQVNDANADGKRQYVATWYSDYAYNYKQTNNYGAICLRLGDRYKKWDGNEPLKISVNGYLLNTGNVPPIVNNDRTLGPRRLIFEALGAGVAWNDAEQAAYAIGNKKLIIMPVGSHDIKVNGETVYSDAAVEILNDRTMVPLRFVSELLGAEVVYDDVQGAVFINK